MFDSTILQHEPSSIGSAGVHSGQFPLKYEVTANMTTDRFPLITAARTAKTGLAIGLAFGLAQDLLSTVKGRPPGYLRFLSKSGKPRRKEAEIMSE